MRNFMKRLTIFSIISAVVLAGLFAPLIRNQADGNKCLSPDAPDCMNGLPTDEYLKLVSEMQANPSPDVGSVDVDVREVNAYSFWRVAHDTALYDGPNGNIVGKMDNGFNFVIVYKILDGFAMLRNKFWVPRSSLKQTYSSH